MAEITPRNLPGRYMALAVALILTAVPVSAFLGMLLVAYAPLGISGWRWVVIIGAHGAALVWIVQRRLPEPPRWFDAHGRMTGADQALKRIETAISAEVGALPPPQANMAEGTATQDRWPEMFQGRYLARTLSATTWCIPFNTRL